MRTRIIIRNKEISEIIQKFAFENYGISWTYNQGEYIEMLNSAAKIYPILYNFSPEAKSLSWDYYSSLVAGQSTLDASTQFGEVIALLTKPKRTEFIDVELDSANIMKVTKNGIHFGKDAFSLDIIDKLVAART